VLCPLESVISWGNCCCQCGTTGLLWVLWFQRLSEFPMGSGSGGGWGTAGCWGCSQLHRRVYCAVVDHAVALLCWFLAALTQVSQHCCLSLCGKVKVWSTVSQKSILDVLGIPLVPVVYCSWMFVLTLMSFTLFGCCQCNLLLQWSQCCCAFLSIHFKTSDAHLVLNLQSCQLS